MKSSNLFERFLKLPMFTKAGAIILLAAVIWFGWSKTLGAKNSAPQYMTATATKGTLVVNLTASGQISGANSAEVTTQTSGVVTKIYVKNGDKVKTGDPIAEVELDMDGRQRSAQAYASYLSAKNSLASAQANMYSLQSTMFSKWKTYTDLAENSTYQNSDGSPNTTNRVLTTFTTAQDDWLAAEAQYANQQNVVAQDQTSVSSAWANYQQASPTIYAPISGSINGLSLQVGSVLTAQTSSTGNSTSQRIANIKTDATPTAVVDLNEVDVPKVKIGDKATLTLSAFPNQTFTGKIVSIDTTGTVSSGVTTYPAYITFDTAVDGIYPNMDVDANIITAVKNNVVLVPNAAVQTVDGQSTVRILKNGQVTATLVTVGSSNDSETQIISGINEGDTVVTGTSVSSAASSTGSSPFSAFGNRSGGNRVFIGGR